MRLKLQKGRDNKFLRNISFNITDINKKVIFLAKNMERFMIKNDGVGLAAPQVGINKRLFVMQFFKDKKYKDYSMLYVINPKINSYSEEKSTDTEGCLSLPDIYGEVERPKEVKVSFLDLKGKEKSLSLSDINARIFQHEFDHLDGILFTDKMSKQVEASDNKIIV